MRIAYFDCFSGASGDMILGSLLAAGWPLDSLEKALACLGLTGYRVSANSLVKQGIAAVQVSFDLPGEPHDRRLGDLLDIVALSSLPVAAKSVVQRVLRRLGEAEAKVHGVEGAVEDIRLHELGSLDTLFDVVGVVSGLRDLHIDSVHVSALNLGSGVVNTAHGLLPVPVPAVSELVRGLPVYGGETDDGELLTPTGAVLFRELASRFGPMPPLTLENVGAGAGRKEGRRPNVVRLFLGTSQNPSATDQVRLLETNIDDMNPELYGPLVERLLAAGALDAYLTPVVMKKGRPAVVLSVLAGEESAAALEEIIFQETTTFGIRSSVMSRITLEREVATVSTRYGTIRVKVGRRGGQALTFSPEFEDCLRAAKATGAPLRNVYDAARAAFNDRRS